MICILKKLWFQLSGTHSLKNWCEYLWKIVVSGWLFRTSLWKLQTSRKNSAANMPAPVESQHWSQFAHWLLHTCRWSLLSHSGQFTFSTEQSVSCTGQHLCPTQQQEPDSLTWSEPCPNSLLVPKTWQSCSPPKPTSSRVLSPTFPLPLPLNLFVTLAFWRDPSFVEAPVLQLVLLCSCGVDPGAEAWLTQVQHLWPEHPIGAPMCRFVSGLCDWLQLLERGFSFRSTSSVMVHSGSCLQIPFSSL